MPQHTSTETIKKSVEEFACSKSLIELKHLGMMSFVQLFPEQLSRLLVPCERGDIFFNVPLEWLDFPFELCYIPQRDFLGSIFRIGTSAYISSPESILGNLDYKERIKNNSVLIIADPSGELPSAYDEGLSIKKQLDATPYMPHLISSPHKAHLLEEIAKASIIHFAGHSNRSHISESTGWKLSEHEYITYEDMRNSGKYHQLPFPVFSNSCNAGTNTTTSGITGIAGAFLNAGVSQIIGSIIPVNSNEAARCAGFFYRSFFENNTPSEALLTTKKKMASLQHEALDYLFYRLFGDPIMVAETPVSHIEKPATTKKIIMSSMALIAVIVLVIMIRSRVTLSEFTSIPKALMGVMTQIMNNKPESGGKDAANDLRSIPKRDTIFWVATNYNVSQDPKVLISEIINKIIGSDALMKLENMKDFPFTFSVRIISYGAVLDELLNGKIDIVSVSPFCFVYHHLLFPESFKEFSCVGQKTLNNKVSSYLSGFIVHEKSGIKSLKDITGDNVRSIFFNEERLSTSTYVIPMIFCVEHGLAAKIEQKQLKTQPEMIRIVREQLANYDKIGTISNEGWNRLQTNNEDSNLRFIPIADVPIPYDPIYINPKRWRNLFTHKQDSTVFTALRHSLRMLDKPWDEEFSIFVRYVASGVITRKDGDRYTVDLAPAGYDLYHMNDTLNVRKSCAASVYQFSSLQIQNSDESVRMVMRKIVTGTLSKDATSSTDSDIATLTLRKQTDESLVGMHVLLDLDSLFDIKN